MSMIFVILHKFFLLRKRDKWFHKRSEKINNVLSPRLINIYNAKCYLKTRKISQGSSRNRLLSIQWSMGNDKVRTYLPSAYFAGVCTASWDYGCNFTATITTVLRWIRFGNGGMWRSLGSGRAVCFGQRPSYTSRQELSSTIGISNDVSVCTSNKTWLMSDSSCKK